MIPGTTITFGSPAIEFAPVKVLSDRLILIDRLRRAVDNRRDFNGKGVAMWQPTRVLLDGMLSLSSGDASIATNKTLKNCWLGLLKDVIAPTLNSDTASIAGHEATFGGYARYQPAIVNGPFVGEVNFSLMSGSSHLFQASDTITPNTIYGQFLTGSDSTTLLAVELFDAPRPMPGPDSGFLVTPIIGLGNNAAGYGSSIVSG